MKRMRRIFFVGLCFLASLTGVFAQEVLLGTTGGVAGDLYNINSSTGAATLIGPLVDGTFNPYAVTGLAFDNVTGILYGSTSNNSATGNRELVAINPNTGAVTVIGAFGVGSGTMADLTFDTTTATLYGTGSLDGNLYSINLTTGVATAVGSSGISGAIQGVGVAANSAGQIFGAPTGANAPLVQYNKSTGAATNGPTLTGAPAPAGSISAMAFNSGGTLYAVDIDNTVTSRPTDLVTINPVTGAVTNIGASVNFLDAIVFYNPTAVPEPSTIGMMFLGFGWLGAITALRRRRRRS
jgi:PEP-CTERM motif